MKAIASLAVAILVSHAAISAEQNPGIDYPGFLDSAAAIAPLRESRRIGEQEFLRMAGEPGTIVLDARSADRFAMLHLKGAVNLPLPDFSEAALARIIPDKTTRILIYCNNNFLGDQLAMVGKRAIASLNIYTFNSLHAYGYPNIYELAPLRDIRESTLPFAGSRAVRTKSNSAPAIPSAPSYFGVSLQK